MIIRDERAADRPVIAALITDAFRTAPHNSGTEATIVDALREAGMLSLSLVAEEDGAIVGQVAFSPVTIDGAAGGWFGLGPVAVRPDRQNRGIGDALIREGLARLQAQGASGCVVLGEPAYYGRFGLTRDPDLILPDVPPDYFLALRFGDVGAKGAVAYHLAFSEPDRFRRKRFARPPGA